MPTRRSQRPPLSPNGGYRGTGLVIPHSRKRQEEEVHEGLEDPSRVPKRLWTERLAVGPAGPDPTEGLSSTAVSAGQLGSGGGTRRDASTQLVDVSTRKTPPLPAFSQVRGVQER